MEVLDGLQKILKKDPVIHTFSSSELIQKPETVEAFYSLHADTHMCLANTNNYLKKIVNCVAENKNTFVGGVVGDYGLGKTSLLVYLWRELSKNNVLAIPPFWWENFIENFKAVYAWTKYQLIQLKNSSAIVDLDNIYNRYTEPSLEDLAKKAKNVGISYEKSYAIITDLYEQGSLKIELNSNNFLNFLEDLAKEFVGKQKLFKGIVVFQDELQRTVEKNTLDMVAGVLFDLSSALCEREGNYGVFFGMPTQTQAALAVERSDIFDRLEAKYKCFINLEELYGSSFAEQLWASYAKYFDFEPISNEIVEPFTLIALGQVTDSKRKDLGNGPRSVISAFNRIVHCYKENKRQYTVTDFVNDCLIGEIVLGERSSYVRKISNLLEMSYDNIDVKSCVKVLAGFAKGCPIEVIKSYDLEAGLAYLTKNFYGELVKETPNGYILVHLIEPGLHKEQSAIENRFIQFRNKYSPDLKNASRAVKAFNKYVIPAVFSGWKDINDNKVFKWTKTIFEEQIVTIRGTFSDNSEKERYPKRVVDLVVTNHPEKSQHSRSKNSHFAFHFHLNWISKGENKNNSLELSDARRVDEVLFKINLLSDASSINIPLINAELINPKVVSPLFCLGLIDYLTEHVIDKTELQELNHLVTQLVSKLILLIFNDDMKTIKNSEKKLNNAGKHLVQDLFTYLCENKFPNYSTLVVSEQWLSRLHKYVSILENEKVSLYAKQGKEPLVVNNDKKVAKSQAADLLGISPATLENWAFTFKDLIDISRINDGQVWLKSHPLEELILDTIEKSTYSINMTGVNCKYVPFVQLMDMSQALGYLEEEVEFVTTKLGENRKFFKLINKDSTKIIYSAPVMKNELQEQLRERLASLKEQINVLQLIDEFDKVFNFQQCEKEINNLSDMGAFESISQKLNTQVEINLGWAQKKLESWVDGLKIQKSSLNSAINNFETTDYRIVGRKLDSNASWVSIVFEIQSEDFNIGLKEVKDGLNDINMSLNKIIQGKAEFETSSNCNLVLQLHNAIKETETKISEVNSLFKVLQLEVKHLRKWHQIGKKADEVLKTCIKAKELGDDTYYSNHQVIGGEIKTHLTKLRKSGLKNDEVFLQKYHDLEKRVKEFVLKFMKAFNTIRNDIANLIENIGGDKIIISKINFTENNPIKSYNQLYDEAFTIIKNVTSEILEKVMFLQTELNYQEKIMDKSKQIIESGIYEKLHKLINDLKTYLKLDLLSMVKSKDYDKVRIPIEEVRNLYIEAQKDYRNLLQPENPSDIENKFLKLLDKNIDKSIKEVILSSDMDLDEILNLLRNLFKKNHLEIRVKRIV